MRVFLIVLLSLFAVPAFAQSLTDAEVETRARDVGRSLRCVVCQNQSIDDSDAALAGDMRALVRTQIRAGQSNEQVLDFMQDRYGDYVLLKPPVQGNTYLLWFAPFLALLGMILWYGLHVRRKPKPSETPPLSEAERRQLHELRQNQDKTS